MLKRLHLKLSFRVVLNDLKALKMFFKNCILFLNQRSKKKKHIKNYASDVGDGNLDKYDFDLIKIKPNIRTTLSATILRYAFLLWSDIKTKYKKYFFSDFLSADFWQKLSESK